MRNKTVVVNNAMHIAAQQAPAVVSHDEIPSNWDIKLTVEGMVEAVNNVSGTVFKGSMLDFNTLINPARRNDSKQSE
jgi:hypothetical protein